MNKPKMNPLVFIGLIGMLTIGTNLAVQLYRAFWGDQDIWWTGRTMQLPMEDSRDDFELFISGKSLQEHLANEGLFVLDNNGERYRVVAKDITTRINNRNKVKSSIMTNALISGVAFGVVLTMLVIGLIQVSAPKRKAC